MLQLSPCFFSVDHIYTWQLWRFSNPHEQCLFCILAHLFVSSLYRVRCHSTSSLTGSHGLLAWTFSKCLLKRAILVALFERAVHFAAQLLLSSGFRPHLDVWCREGLCTWHAWSFH